MTLRTRGYTFKPMGKDRRLGLGAVTQPQKLRGINFQRKQLGLPLLRSLEELEHLKPGSSVEALGRSGERKE